MNISNPSYALLNWSFSGDPCCTDMAYGFRENSSPTIWRSQLVVVKYFISVASPRKANPEAVDELRTLSTASSNEFGSPASCIACHIFVYLSLTG